MTEEIFDRQGLTVEVVPPKNSYQAELAQPEKLRFRVLRPSGQVELRIEHLRELYHGLGDWIDKFDKVKKR